MTQEQKLIEYILEIAHQKNGVSIFKIQDALRAVLKDVDAMVEDCRVKDEEPSRETLYFNNNDVILTKKLLSVGKTINGGFTSAQIEYFGFSFGDKWLDKCIGIKISKEEYEKFLSFKEVDSKTLKLLKNEGNFRPIILK